MEVSKRFYIRSTDPLRRLANLKKLAQHHFRGNFSEMVNDALNRVYGLDPDTGEAALTEMVADAMRTPASRRRKKTKR